MARPKNKEELLALSKAHYHRLLELVDGFTEADQRKDFPQYGLNRNIRDVLAHLHHWHKMMLGWYELGMAGEKPAMPAKGYTWKTVPDLNREIWNMYKEQDLVEVKEKLDNSFQEVQQLMFAHTDEELFTKKKYNWTGSTSLGAYLISASSSHYDWAWKLIKKSSRESS